MTLHFCQMQQLTTELATLECLIKSMSPLFSVAIDLNFFNLEIRRKCIMSWMYSNFSRLDDRQQSYLPLRIQKNIPIGVIMGENDVLSFS